MYVLHRFGAIPSRIYLLLQMIFSFLGLYGLYFLRPFLSLDGTKSCEAADKISLCPLILVHPGIQNRAAWYFYQATFRKAGYSAIYYFEYSSKERSLFAPAERLALFVEEVATRNPEAKPILIGASLGGLVARASLCFLSESAFVGGLITLACPHKGSRLAKLVPKRLFPLLNSIFYDSPTIQELEAKEAVTPVNIPKTAFFSCRDEIVRPTSALYPPANLGWREVKIMPVSHMSIMLHTPTINAVITELEQQR